MAKIMWEVSEADQGFEVAVAASTRADAVAAAEAEWLRFRDYEEELVGMLNDDGSVFTRTPIPKFTAKKVSQYP